MLSINTIQDQIRRMLGCLVNYVSLSNSQGYTDVNVACENLVLGMMNLVYNYRLENYNSKRHVANAKGIDLIDEKNKICVQVSSKHTKAKLEETFKGVNETDSLAGYHLIFFALVSKANNLRNNDSKERDIFSFKGKKDVIDLNSFCSDLGALEVQQLHVLNNFICSWLGHDYYDSATFASKMDKRNQQQDFDEIEEYYPRSISIANSNSFSIDEYLYPEKYKSHTFIDFIQGNVAHWNSQYWLLIAAGQTGKSYETKHLAFQLSKSNDAFPVIFEAKTFKNQDDDFQLPFCYQPEHIVYIIDGIDEISSEKLREAFIEKVSLLRISYPTLRIVMTCRRNYIDSTKFPDFQRLRLNKISFNEIKKIVKHSDLESPDEFIRCIEVKKLYQIAGIPFFLKAMMKHYREHRDILENRLKLYRYLINSSYNADKEKKKGQTIDAKTHGDNLLRRIALILQLTEENHISETDLKRKMNFADFDIELCKRFTIFHCDEAYNYSFEVNSFEMFYVADFLLEQSAKEILNLISFRQKNVLRIRPEWYDIFELLLSSIDNDDERRTELLEWTYENDIEALLNVDANSLEPEFIDRVFKSVLQKYKQKRISSSPEFGLDFHRRLAALCTTKESLQFFITEYRNEKSLGPYLYLLSFVYWFIDADYIRFNELTEEYKDVCYDHLYEFGKQEETIWYEALYVPFHNDIFLSKEDIERLICSVDDISDRELKICIFRLIEKTSYCDEFIDFTIGNEKYIHDYRRNGDSATHSVSRDSVLYILTHINQYESIKKLWGYYPQLIKRNCGSYEENKQDKLRCDILSLTEKHITNYPDLIRYVTEAWVNESKKHHITHTQNSTYQSFRNFFVRNNLCKNGLDACEQLYNAFKDGKSTNEDFYRIYANIILVITEDEINTQANLWDADDNYRCTLMSWLRSTPLPEVNMTVQKWINNKFVNALSPYDNQPSYEQMNLDMISLIFDQSRFKKVVNHILEKYGSSNRKEIWMRIREDDEEQLNNYIMQYLRWHADDKTDRYNIQEIKTSLKQRLPYYTLIVHVVRQNNDVAFTVPQKRIIEKALKALLVSDNIIPIDKQKCLELILKFNIELDSELIVKLLPYAGVSYCIDSKAWNYIYFIDYARRIVDVDIIKRYLPDLITQEPLMGDESHLIKIAELIVSLRMTNLYLSICERIKNSLYREIDFAHVLLGDTDKGVNILKAQFSKFSSNVQLYIIEQFARMPKQQKWAMAMTVEFRNSFTSDENKNALLIQLRLGYDKAIDECIEWLSKEINSLCTPFMAPSLNYIDKKYLPQLLTLLRIVWDAEEPHCNWRTRVEDALTKMAAKNLEQYEAVINGLKQLIIEDEQYKRLNYFIGQLQKSDPRLKDAKISIAEALIIVEKYDKHVSKDLGV